jgi:CubicO group peptidase (beta-lactamase class C family)
MPSHRRTPVLSLFVVLLSASLVHADPVDDFVRAQMQRFNVAGLSLAVVKDGVLVKAEGYGLANVELETPATAETIFKIGSVSKQFIATGIMLLVQEGRIGLADPVSKYLEGTPPSWAPITIRHFLTHTSGVVRESPGFDPYKIQSDADLVKAAYAAPLRFPAGTKWEYCNTSYFALAEIIRVVSGQPWSEFLRSKVFAPSGMTDTGPTTPLDDNPRRAAGYAGKDNTQPAADWPAVRPSGAFLSTVLDLVKWEHQLSTAGILNEASLKEMWSPVKLADGSIHRYGFGWELHDIAGRRHIGHGGSLPGFRSAYARFPDDGLTVILLINADDVDRGGIVAGIVKHYSPVAVTK